MSKSKGFILPTVIGLSLATIIIMSSLFVLATSTYKDGYNDYYQKLADEAAEAGVAYASACLTISSHTQTWGNTAGVNNLRPGSDCNGANTYASNTHVYSDSELRSTFSVGNLDYSTPFSAQISATGTVEVLGEGGVVRSTYANVRKKVITWPTEVVAQMSASGTNRTCAVVNYKVYCWGNNRFGQLGDGRYIGGNRTLDADLNSSSAIDSPIPVKVRRDPGVMANKRIVKVFAAQHHSCALSDDGLMYCWGYNYYGQLGSGNNNDSAVPVQVGGALAGQVITDIGGSHDATCAIAATKIYCWGRSVTGLTGRNTTTTNFNTPGLVTATSLPAAYTATALSTNGSRAQNMCAIIRISVSGVPTGRAYCWGQNNNGAVGDNTTANKTVPTAVFATGVLNGLSVTSIALDGWNYTQSGQNGGFAHVCAVASSRVFCWGDNSHGQLGDGTTTRRLVPVAVVATGVLSGKTAKDVQVGLRHSCTLASGGVYCWGSSAVGQVGNNSTTNTISSPVPVTLQPGALTASNVIAIGAGANRGCAVINDGRTFCWGYNNAGQIGDGTKVDRLVPTESLFLRPSGNEYIY